MGSALGIATGNQDLAVWIFAMDASNGGPSVMIRRGGHGTGIEDYNIGQVGIPGTAKPAIFELSLDRRSVGLRRATAEVLYIKAGHKSIIATVP